MSAEIWLTTANKRPARSQDAFWNTCCSLLQPNETCRGEVSMELQHLQARFKAYCTWALHEKGIECVI